MIQGKCPRCGRLYFGWALAQPDNQKCVKCKTGLLITHEEKMSRGDHLTKSVITPALQIPGKTSPEVKEE